ncbi:sulfite exporter TauE/SafE family protein [Oceanobacillus salinisoli]|uniref:sulfite exporter TauE/SafE family protein n=1 Tax=Oceanobacillus salinisoli TaxID=2678611 RepID=UPI0012E1EF1F|nr:sulfite exporter TauE/SafE family protein [Oceanobacillus salinisoli]
MILLLLFLGFLASVYGAIIGAGGGFLFVPILLIFYEISPAEAAATGLAIVFINAISGLPTLLKQHRVFIRIGILISICAVPATFIGRILVKYSPVSIYYNLFACLLIGLGIFLIWKNHSNDKASLNITNPEISAALEEKTEAAHVNSPSIKTWKLIFIGFLLGIISSFFGIGGGWLLVPLLVYFFYLPMKEATATSIFSLALYSLAGLLPSIADHSIDWFVIACSTPGIIIGAQLGAMISKKLNGLTIGRLLAAVVVIMGVGMFFQG